ncbi:FAD-dependent oxidoreductase, partial [Mesorhizobium sp. M00.F.Ca.ET.186.01.1.1]
MQTYEVIIAGAGSMGMAAGYYLAKRGVSTLMIDAFDPPHTMGSHHGDTRIIRHAYGEGKQYVPFALRAQELWRELEEASGMKLFSQTGVLSAGAKD